MCRGSESLLRYQDKRPVFTGLFLCLFLYYSCIIIVEKGRSMKLRKINNVSLVASNMSVGDSIKVGESANLIIDKIPTDLEKAFQKIREIVARQADNPGNAQLLKQHNVPMSQTTFTHLFAFAKVIAQMFPDLGCKDFGRQTFYGKNPNAKLSDLFERHLFQCAEYATIAQLYLQSVGVDSEYVGGEFVGSKTWEFGDQHSFVVIHENGIDYVFDPANNNAGNMPNISVVEMTPEQKVKFHARLLTDKRKVAFFGTRDIMTNRKAFYGYGDGSYLEEDMFFTKDNLSQNMPKMDLSRS